MTKTTKYNFDEVISRVGTDAIKWDEKFMEAYLGTGDLLPLWVADMDFRAPEALLKALKTRVEHGIFGYTIPPESYFQAIISWFKRRHDWVIDKEWVKFAPGVVPAINFIIQTFSQPGDGVIIQEPVYYPFADSIKSNGRNVINNNLIIENDQYLIDFRDFEKKCKSPRVKMFILCSPHNPVGRVWTLDELKQMGEICLDNNLLVISDEIHCDLIFPNHKHIPFASISNEFAQKTITCVAPSKTFNIAGLKTSNVIISDKVIRDEFATTMDNLSIDTPTIFGIIATEVTYNDCEVWLDELLKYLWKNYLFLKEYIQENFPTCKVFNLEGTYLPWVDFRPLKIEPKTLDTIIKMDAKVGLDDGAMFGESGAGFQRFNIACPMNILHEALDKIKNAINNYEKKIKNDK